MSSIDERTVKMKFDNASFMKGAADTQKSLADLNKSVDSAGKTRGLLDLNSQMSAIGVTASKMAIVTTTALATIANKVVNTGLQMASALTLDPIRSGFSEYEALLTKQNTIMNATGLSAKVVKKYLNELNKYSDRTIYSFGNMSESIMKFVNAGVPLKEAIGTVKGIANAAAFAGASTNDANRAMFAFGQSISNGFLTLGDFNQIESANMATVQFKETLLEAAAAAGTLRKEGDMYVTKSGERINATKGFQYSLQEQWATTEVLNSALNKYSDTSTKLGKKAAESATEVRTFTAFMDTLKESIGSGWSSIFSSLIGNLNQATNFWTGFSNAVGGGVKSVFNFLSRAVRVWRQMGGFQKTMQGFQNILAPFAALLSAIGDAWEQAFPSGDGKGPGKALYGLSAGFEAITRPLQWLASGIPAITPVLVVFFKAIAAGGKAVGDVIGFIIDFVQGAKELADLDAPNAGGFLGFVQDVTRAIQGAIEEVDLLIKKAGGLGGLFSGFDVSVPGLPSLPDVGGGADEASKAADGASEGMSRSMEILSSIAVKMGEIFGTLWDKAKEFFSGVSMEDLVSSFNLAILATMSLSISRFFNAMSKSFGGFAGIGENVKGVLGATEDALKSFQTAARAKLILNIAIAIGVLAAALWVLSKIPVKDLVPALAAMGALFAMMNVTMKGFASTLKATDGMVKSVNMIGLAASILILSAAMILFATAMLIMNKVEWKSIAKGLITLGVALKLIENLGNTAEGAYKNMLAGALAIGVTSAALLVLAGALLLFQLVKWESMGKAGAALAGVALAVGVLALIPYQGIAKVGAALLIASVGMIALAGALLMFDGVKWESMGKAAVMLTLLAVALAVIMAVGGPVSVLGMLGLAASMILLAQACVMFNDVEWASIAKATVVLTVLLAALAVGAVILTAFLYAIAPVSPVLIILAAGFALLGIGLLAFAAAMTIAMGLATAGTAAFAVLATGAAVAIGVFLQTLALQAPIMRESILTIIDEFIKTIVESIPIVMQGFKDMWKAIMKELQSGDKKRSFGEIANEWIDKFIEFARKQFPKLQALAVDLALSMLQALNKRADEFSKVGTQLIVSLIDGVADRQQAIVNAAINLVIKMAEGIRKNVKKLTDAGIDLIAGFLHDLADSIRSGSSEIGAGITDVVDAFRDVGVQMVQGLINGVSSVDIQGVIEDLAAKLPGWARKVLGIASPSKVFRDIGKFIAQGLTKGIQDHAASAIVATASMMAGTIAVANEYVNKFIQKLDQSAIEARAKAQGLARAAQRAARAADKTKSKKDDQAAQGLSKAARRADRAADKAERKADAAEKAEDRKERWENASSAQRAEIRSKDAQRQMDAAKDAQKRAAANLAEAAALERQAKAEGVTGKQRREFERRAEQLRKEAREEAKKANRFIQEAREAAASALVWQKKAGQEAALSFQEQFDQQAQADADAEAFDKLSDEEKAKKLREQAAALQAKADADLARAKKLAFTDIDKANELAQQALDEAAQARDLIDQAEDIEADSTTSTPQGATVNLEQTAAAATAAAVSKALYDSAYAEASGSPGVTFIQNNTSPESLSAADIYRQTNNQVTFAAQQLGIDP